MKRALWSSIALGCAACHDARLDLERMIDQRKLEAYEASTAFADGKAMRSPPPGTVPHTAQATRERQASELTADEELRQIPVALTSELLRRGRDRFDIYCATCHGRLGDGRSQVAENMRLRPPPSLHEQRLRALPIGQLYRVIRDGYGLMPAYGSALSVDDRWAVIAYVGALQLSQNAELGRLPDNLQREAAPWLK